MAWPVLPTLFETNAAGVLRPPGEPCSTGAASGVVSVGFCIPPLCSLSFSRRRLTIGYFLPSLPNPRSCSCCCSSATFIFVYMSGSPVCFVRSLTMLSSPWCSVMIFNIGGGVLTMLTLGSWLWSFWHWFIGARFARHGAGDGCVS